jgi:hypothetical protein
MVKKHEPKDVPIGKFDILATYVYAQIMPTFGRSRVCLGSSSEIVR